MKVTGKVVDKSTGKGLPAASIYVADQNQKPTDIGVLSDNDGNFSLDTPALDDVTNYLAISYAGYIEDIFIPSNDGKPYVIELEPEGGDLYTVFVTAKRKVKQVVTKNKKWIPWVVAGSVGVVGISLFAFRKRIFH